MKKQFFNFIALTCVFRVTAKYDIPFIVSGHIYYTLKVADPIGNEYILIIRHTPNSYNVVILPSTDLIKSLFSFLEDGPAVEDFEMEGYCNEFNKLNVPASPYVKFEIKLTV